MSVIATRKELAQFFQEQPNRMGMLSHVNGYIPIQSKTAAIRIIRKAVKEGRFLGKQLRPWNVVPPASKLDASQVWAGFEMETGYSTTARRLAAIQWFDKTIKRGCYDREGSGQACVEFTFYPTELSKIDTCDVTKLIKLAQTIPPAPHNSETYIGTHVNISTPASRQGRRINTHTIATAIGFLSDTERRALFGRGRTYSGIVYSHPSHYEFKVFNTTYNLNRWKAYCVTVRKLVEVIQYLEDSYNPAPTISSAYYYVPDRDAAVVIRDMLRSAIPEINSILNPPQLAAAA